MVYPELAGAKLLIVEDDPEVGTMVRIGLEDAGFQTTLCRDGARAMRLAETGAYAAILLDRMIPTCDGLSFLRALRGARRNVPVLMLTAMDTVPDRIDGLEAGADDYLGKPFDFDELLARVRALLRRENTLKESIVTVDDLMVDTRRRSVERAGVPIVLTAREYLLVEALATHTGQILSREAIVTRVWVGEASLSNTVDVTVKNVRKKIDQGHARPLIHTVYGMGYVMRT